MRFPPSIILFVFAAITWGQCARILSIFHFPSPSHHILGSHLLKELARRGHQVTMISPFPLKKPMANYTDIYLEEISDYKGDNVQNAMNIMNPNGNPLTKLRTLPVILTDFIDLFWKNKGVQDLIKSKEKYDLLIMSYTFNECFLGLAHHVGAPVIAFSPVGAYPITHRLTGNPSPYSYVPNVMVPGLSGEMNLLERTLNTVVNLAIEFVSKYFNEPYQQTLVSKFFPNAPPLKELIGNVSLVLINSHYSIEGARPYLPNMIPIGGFHMSDPKELPSDLKKYLDDAKDGAILFSLGSNIKVSFFSKEKLDAVLKILEKLAPMRVVFKSEMVISNAPGNVFVKEWVPQSDILGHKNVKLFITHGGLGGTTEAVWHGVPMLGIPFFADQYNNMAQAVKGGYAVEIRYEDITEGSFRKSLLEALHNSKYRENIKLRSRLFKQQPMKPLEKAIFWVEHVIEHKGARHLRNTGMNLAWYQYYLLDVAALIFGVILTTALIIYLILKLLYIAIKIACCGSKSRSKTKTQ